MANKIVESNIPPAKFVDFTSRYMSSDVIYYGDNHILTFKTYVRNPPVLSPSDKYYLITQATQYRPDLVSQLAYGFPSYWWRLLEANGMKDISDFVIGTTIRIPSSLS